MRHLMIAVVLFLVASIASAQGGGVNLSQRITETYPWPAYGGHCAPLVQGELKDILPWNIAASVSFSGRWEVGYLLAGEPVAYAVAETCNEGEWRELLRVLRCGNPATGRYFHKYPPERTVTVQVPPVETCTTVTNTRTVIVPELVVCRQTQIIKTPVRVPVYLCPPAHYVPGAAVAANVDNGGIRFTGVQASDRVQIGAFWGSRTYRSSTTFPPTPPPPPPNDPGVVAPPGDPSGQVPCPPPSDPNAPPAQPDHETGGQPWEPGPDHPNVADPVVTEGAPGDPTAP